MRRIALGAIAALVISAAGIGAASAASPSCDNRENNTYRKLTECVTPAAVTTHLTAFQAIADANNNTRASGTSGYDASVDYAVGVFKAAGYDVTVQPFTFSRFAARGTLSQVSPPPAATIEANVASYSGGGDVTAAVSVPSGSAQGCNASDFAGFTAGNIALVSRGSCTFATKATNAYNAGAKGVVLYNNTTGPLNPTLSDTFTLDIPVMAVTQAEGQRLVGLVPAGLTLQIALDVVRGEATTYNVIADSPGGNPDNVVVSGAHLDSVFAGPGVNDNGSGSSTILAVAQSLAHVKPVNKLRFTLWGAEESGLVGSNYYVAQLSQAQKDQIALYLNFDMVGSPNYVFFVYDGDDSDGVGSGPGPAGSAAIEQTFIDYYNQVGVPSKGTDFSGRSDYFAFIGAGIPAGGLFTGAEGVKTPEEAAIWGGTAGVSYDHCYHQKCDTIANVDQHAIDVNSDAVAYTVLTFAFTTEAVNGVVGEPVPGGNSFLKGKAPGKSFPGTTRDSVHSHLADAS